MEPSIERIKTSVYFTDAGGVEWEVVDAARRRDGRWWKDYPGAEWAEVRYFVRYSPASGTIQRRALEVRRYRFRPGESRWFIAADWAAQLAAAVGRRVATSSPSIRADG